MRFLEDKMLIDHVEWNDSDGNFASNCREQPEPLPLHQRKTPNTITLLYCYKHRANTHSRHLLFVFVSAETQYHFFIIQMMHILTLRSGMENLQQEEARLVLAMVRLSFSTLVKLVLSSGTEISQKSVMTSHRYCLWHQTVILSRQTCNNMNFTTEICRVLF